MYIDRTAHEKPSWPLQPKPERESYTPPIYLIPCGGPTNAIGSTCQKYIASCRFFLLTIHCQHLVFEVWAVVTVIALVRLGIVDALARRGSETDARLEGVCSNFSLSLPNKRDRACSWYSDTCYVSSRAHLRSNMCTSALVCA